MDVNDGGGLYDSIGLADTLIVDCNRAVKSLVEGQYIAFCATMTEMAQKLTRLKEGIRTDIESRDRQIGELKRLCGEHFTADTGIPADDAPAFAEGDV